MLESSGMTLMDLITSDSPAAPPPSSSSSSTTAPPPHSPSSAANNSNTKPPPPSSSSSSPLQPAAAGGKSSWKKSSDLIMQIQSDTFSAAKAAVRSSTNIIPSSSQKHKKKALTTVAIRSGEPYRLQIYEFLHALAQGGMQTQFSDMHVSNGEDQGASGTGLGSLISPMLNVLDEMCSAQDELIKDMRNHDNTKKEWTDEELKRLYETHERLLDLASLFCFIPRTKYLPLGPTSIFHKKMQS